MTFGSFCSGIEAASEAWCRDPLNWKAQWLAEIQPFCCELLTQRWAGSVNLGDVTSDEFLHRVGEQGPIDVLVGGTPCQGFSTCGHRKGLDDPRSQLFWRFCDVARQMRPRWIVWENVPGVLSQNQGRDFAAILGQISGIGYGIAWRVLDAQYFGVPQSRDRVFLVGHLRDWRCAAAVLFEHESLRRDSSPGFQTKPHVAHAVAAGAGGSKFGSGRDNQDDYVVSSDYAVSNSITSGKFCGIMPETNGSEFVIATTVTAADGPKGRLSIQSNYVATTVQSHHGGTVEENLIAHAITSAGHDASEDVTGRGIPIVFDPTQITSSTNRSKPEPGKPSPTVSRSGRVPHVAGKSRVRKLTPREVERLFGFPDDYTLIQYRGKPAADSPRYVALGNSIAVPVLRWIGERIELVDSLQGVTA